MGIQRRLNPRVKLAIHKRGGSVLDPPLYLPLQHSFYKTNPHLSCWPNGAEVLSTHGKKTLLIGFTIYREGTGYRCWVVKKVVERLWYRTPWQARCSYYAPTVRKKPYVRAQAYKDFNQHKDVEHVGVFATKPEAREALVEAYEAKHDLMLTGVF
jgi:hypothetical protein